MHCCCCVIYNDIEGMDGNFNEILERHTGYGFDYFTSVDENEKSVKRFKGFVLKDETENEYMYEVDGMKFAYKAKINEVDWKKTFEVGDFSSFATHNMFVDEFLFYNEKTKKINIKEFNNLAKRLIAINDTVQIVDIHM